jgi:hypothetical protein
LDLFFEVENRLLASPRFPPSGTVFLPDPPEIFPRLAVVSSLIRPSFIRLTAWEAMTMALIPLSGEIPACAALPINAARMES